jgi:hypothetical protein
MTERIEGSTMSTEALRELLEAMTTPFPPETAGQQAQTEWGDRQASAVAQARAALAAAPAGGAEPACPNCGGTGVDGDVGDRGEIVETPCACRSTAPTAQPQPVTEFMRAALNVEHSLLHDGPGDVVIALREKLLPVLSGMLDDCGYLPDLQRAAPTLLNGLTEQETAASASVAGLSGAQPEAPAEPSGWQLNAITHVAAWLGDLQDVPRDASYWTNGRFVADCMDAHDVLLAAPAAQQPAGPSITTEMITAYLQANDAYWHDADSMPLNTRDPSKWRSGTPREATLAGLRAALDAAIKAQGSSQ